MRNGLRPPGKTMNSRTQTLAYAKKYLGVSGRPNEFTKWYAKKHGSEFLKAAWCDMFVSYIAHLSGVGNVVGEFAYTPSHVAWFKAKKQWGKTPKVGAIVFFDWNKDGQADHVGIVESFKGNRIITIEGNRGDRVERVERNPGVILGYGYPAYPNASIPKVYTVQKGDSLVSIAFHTYSDYSKWRDIYKANLKVIGRDPALIQPGMKLTLPNL